MSLARSGDASRLRPERPRRGWSREAGRSASSWGSRDERDRVQIPGPTTPVARGSACLTSAAHPSTGSRSRRVASTVGGSNGGIEQGIPIPRHPAELAALGWTSPQHRGGPRAVLSRARCAPGGIRTYAPPPERDKTVRGSRRVSTFLQVRSTIPRRFATAHDGCSRLLCVPAWPESRSPMGCVSGFSSASALTASGHQS
jgi:hypothetical protein